MELRAKRSFSVAGHPRDLFMAETVDIMQDEHAPSPRWQRGDGALEINTLLDVDRRHGAISRRVVEIVSERYASVATLIGARPHEHDIYRNAMQPRTERRVTAKGRQSLPGANEHVLRELPRLLMIGRHAKTKSVYAAGMRAIQHLERIQLARPRARDEGLFVSRISCARGR
jgi:hypothetical protein